MKSLTCMTAQTEEQTLQVTRLGTPKYVWAWAGFPAQDVQRAAPASGGS